MDFHLVHQKVLLLVMKPLGMRMQWEHPTVNLAAKTQVGNATS